VALEGAAGRGQVGVDHHVELEGAGVGGLGVQGQVFRGGAGLDGGGVAVLQVERLALLDHRLAVVGRQLGQGAQQGRGGGAVEHAVRLLRAGPAADAAARRVDAVAGDAGQLQRAAGPPPGARVVDDQHRLVAGHRVEILR
jgi:hypothetical protein